MSSQNPDPWDEETEAGNGPQEPTVPPPQAEPRAEALPPTRRPASLYPLDTPAPAPPLAAAPPRAAKPYARPTASNGGPKGPPSELYINGVRRTRDNGEEAVFFNLSVGGAGYDKWGLDKNHWYNGSFWFNLDQLRDFLGSDMEVAKNVGKGKLHEPKPKEFRA